MTDERNNRAGSDPVAEFNPKLRAALEYLGDRLSTHPASRFIPRTRPLLADWLATRRPRVGRCVTLAPGGYRSWTTSLASAGFPNLGD